jgi:hypothetical protein
VWGYYTGGYQVIKKWLSYREDEILGRTLTPDEAREVMNTARRIAAIILLQPKLDENYRSVKKGPPSTGPQYDARLSGIWPRVSELIGLIG